MKEAVLLVDDEAIILLALSRELRLALGPGVRVETALNAAEAFSIIEDLEREGLFLRVAVSDWLMPGMRGDEFLIALRRRYPKVGLIMVTGQADDEAIDRVVKEAGVLACVRKPWRSAELLSLIRQSVADGCQAGA
ncbi:MAG TPA: response regulator [Spirochaetales bacterium]|nr:response regulator [Spirochaetales bacterium]MBP7264876.1 response regulator [Spirochaetia bacterium]HPE36514.1 response regulator [Spirochaetales bacterium]